MHALPRVRRGGVHRGSVSQWGRSQCPHSVLCVPRARFSCRFLSSGEYGGAARRLAFYTTHSSVVLRANQRKCCLTKKKRLNHFFPFHRPQVYDKKSPFDVLFVLSQEEKIWSNLRILSFTGRTRCHWENSIIGKVLCFVVFFSCLPQLHIIHSCVLPG